MRKALMRQEFSARLKRMDLTPDGLEVVLRFSTESAKEIWLNVGTSDLSTSVQELGFLITRAHELQNAAGKPRLWKRTASGAGRS
jgi:hypothetical protein